MSKEKEIVKEICEKYKLKEKDISPNYLFKDDSTMAMEIASRRVIPSARWYHDPCLRDKYKNTVALFLAWDNIIPPKEWLHPTEWKGSMGRTVALFLALGGITPPTYWHHDPTLRDDYSR